MLEITPLFSGSSGNSLHVRCNDVEILIDAGVSFRNISKALEKIGSSPERIKCIFVTHEHNDHIKGMRILASTYNIPVYASAGTMDFLEANGHVTPKFPFEIIDEKGPAHRREYVAIVKLGDKVLGSGTGTSKKEAEQNAANIALSKI
jgi:phosphoribosyl 1,2-cyclic phosphodiesterase